MTDRRITDGKSTSQDYNKIDDTPGVLGGYNTSNPVWQEPHYEHDFSNAAIQAQNNLRLVRKDGKVWLANAVGEPFKNVAPISSLHFDDKLVSFEVCLIDADDLLFGR